MNGLTLKHLRYFEAVARHGHFGRAAESCAVSQPALSVQIRDLEDLLGVVLFERGARQVRLTGFGEDFAQRVHPILRAIDELGDMARAAGSGPMGRLRLGVIPTIAPYLLPTLLGHLGETFPALDIQVRETLTPRLIQELTDGRLDTAIVALPVSEPALTEVALFSENLVLVRPVDDHDKPVPNHSDLQSMNLLLLEEGHCFRDQALSFCNFNSGGRRDGLDGTSLSTLVQMVGAGIGVTLIPEMALPVESRSAPVSIARFKHPEPSRTIGMIWRKTSPLDHQLTEISNVVRQSAHVLSKAWASHDTATARRT